MAGLKELRNRIEAIKSTQKITSAMKMVAASGLRRAQSLIAKSEFYNRNLWSVARRALSELEEEARIRGKEAVLPHLLSGNGKDQKYLLVVLTSDRGLCGSFNANVAKVAAARIEELQAAGKDVQIFCIGKKGKDILKRKYGSLIVQTLEGVAKKGAKYAEAEAIGAPILDAFLRGDIDVCEVVVSHFKSALNHPVQVGRLLPLALEKTEEGEAADEPRHQVAGAFYDYEPAKPELLEGLLPLIFRGSVFQAIVNSQASEQAARMTSMENATSNAKDMISRLTLRYNRIRQTAITTELIEIIAGAEAI